VEAYLWLVIDLIALAVLVILALKGRSDGFVKTVVRACGLLIAVVGGWLLSAALTPVLYDSLLRQPLSDLVASLIAEHGNITETAAQLEASLPAVLLNLITAASGMSLSQQAAALTGDLHGALLELIAPAVLSLVKGCLFLLLCGLILILVAVLVKKLSSVNKLPVLGKLNQVLGAVLGLVEGVFYLLLFAILVSWISGMTNYAIPYLTREVLEASYLFRLAGLVDPVGLLAGMI